MSTVGSVIGGRFRIDRQLGSGGMGIVVAATHLELGHRVAIKFLRDDVITTPTVIERFLREARSVVHLRTEHVCRVIDVGRIETGAPYIVMELLEGSDLARMVTHGPLPVAIAVEYVMQACVALAEAHAAGIIHRDLKPSNLFVTRRPGGGPLIKVLDFGIAKAVVDAGPQLTQSHIMLGSPGYMSPEQLRSARDVDVRTDIWALGATLYQLLSARLPFQQTSSTAIAVRILMEAPDPLDADPALREVVLRCLEKEPEQRYPDVAALAAALVPFGGPSAPAIAAVVGQLLHGSIARPPPPTPVISPFEVTAAASVASVAGLPAQAPVRSVASVAVPPAPMRSVASVAGPPASATAVATVERAMGAVAWTGRRRRWWWIALPLIVLSAVAVAAFYAGRDTTTTSPPQGSGSAAPVVAVVAPVVDAGPPDAAPPDAAPKDPPAKVASQHHPRPRDPAHPSPPGGGAKPPTIAGSVAATAREAKNTCLESTADTPWNTAMCWCTKKDQARAQAAFAKLSGFKRATVRTYCAARGVNL